MTELLTEQEINIVRRSIEMPNGKTFRNQFIEVVPEGSVWVVSNDTEEIRIPFTGVHADERTVRLAVNRLLG